MEIRAPEYPNLLRVRLNGRVRRLVRFGALGGCLAASMFGGAMLHRAGIHESVLRPALEENVAIPYRWARSLAADPIRLSIDMKFKHHRRLKDQRDRALAERVLFTQDSDFVPATITVSGKTARVKMRLKGDATDHLTGDKWSFRVQVDGEATLLGMRKFSLHRPEARHYLFEWLYHRWLAREDVLALQYHFISVTLNGKDLGIYALEEAFDKRLLERQSRREGPILKFDEEPMWHEMAGLEWPFPESRTNGMGAFEASPVSAFGLGKIEANATLRSQYEAAAGLLERFRRGEMSTSQAFHVERLAKYCAIADIMGGQHAALWYNTRFYYDPFTGRLEPIGFDATAGEPLIAPMGMAFTFFEVGGELVPEHERLWQRLFEDRAFFAEYVRVLEKLADRAHLDELMKELEPEIDRNLAIMWREVPTYRFPSDILYRHQEYVRRLLHPARAIHAEWLGHEAGRLRLRVGNLQYLPIEITGVVLADGSEILLGEPILLDGRRPDRPMAFLPLEIPLPADFADISPNGPKIRHRVLGTTSSIEVAATRAARDTSLGFMTFVPNASTLEFLVIDAEEGTISFLPGGWRIDRDVILPPDHSVRMLPGTELDLVNGAVIVSRSPLKLLGTEEAPIVVRSSDGTGQGLLVAEAEQLSELRHVRFHDLTSVDRKGLVLTGAVTFYESPVILDRVTIVGSKAEDGLNLVRSDFEIDGLTVLGARSDAFDADFCNGEIQNSRFFDCGNDCVDLSGSRVELSRIVVEGAGDKGLSTGEASMARASDLTVRKARAGVVSKDRSELTVKGLRLEGCDYDLAVIQKKSEFGPANARIIDLTSVNGGRHLVEPGNTLVIDGKKIDPNVEDAFAILYPPEG